MTLPDRPISICVFCGARDNVAEKYLNAGSAFGKALAEAGIRLIFGGGNCGMMGAVSNATMAAGGEVIGVFPRHLRSHEKEHTGITQTILVDSMHERKQTMFDLTDMFAVLPGGFGTMDETMEILTWRQIGLHNKPLFIFNQDGYWTPLLEMMEKTITEGFARPSNREFAQEATTLESLLEAILKEKSKKEQENA